MLPGSDLEPSPVPLRAVLVEKGGNLNVGDRIWFLGIVNRFPPRGSIRPPNPVRALTTYTECSPQLQRVCRGGVAVDQQPSRLWQPGPGDVEVHVGSLAR